jgi:hypothetical protein
MQWWVKIESVVMRREMMLRRDRELELSLFFWVDDANRPNEAHLKKPKNSCLVISLPKPK